MQHFTQQTFNSWERFYRANFMNCLTGFKPVVLIGTSNSTGQHNLAIFNNIMHLGAHPPLIAFQNRPREATPHTLSNIEQQKKFSLNLVDNTFYKQAHQTSAKYAEDVSEFEAVGLTAELPTSDAAPMVLEAKVKMQCTLQQIIPIELNNTYIIVGHINEVWLPEEIVSEDGYLNLAKAGIICSSGTDGYYTTELLERLPYAKP
jgi:flavin reductase (DIM6/NTAB) family NADH-FMN oxidoreductase RutF